MTPRARWSRRRFLQGLAALAALAAGGGWARWSAPRSAEDLLASVPEARMSAAAVGREYLRARGDVPAPQTLVTEIASRIPEMDDLVSRGSLDTIRAAVREVVRSDFAAEDVVRVRGWILASTEARVCGLVALAVDGGGLYGARR